MIRALIFDMDGTLIDSEKLHYDAWKEILSRHGVDSFPFGTFIGYIGSSNEKLAGDYIDSHGIPSDITTMVLEKQAIYFEMIPTIKLLPGVREVIARYHGRYSLAIASSSHTRELHRILQVLALSEYFDHVVGGDMVTRKKPDPEIFLHTRGLLGVASSECVVFEDSEPGIIAAKAAGMFGIAVPNGFLSNADFSQADRIIPKIDLADDQLMQELSR